MPIPGWNAEFDDQDIAWVDTDVPGVRWYLVESLPVAREAGPRSRPGAAVLIRMEPGSGYPAHRHVGDEHVLVLRGGYRDDRGGHTTGSYVHYEAGSAHAPVALGDIDKPVSDQNPACVLFAVAPGGIELIERDRQP